MSWDPKSSADVALALEQIQAVTLLLAAALRKPEPDAARVRALFADLHEITGVGEMAASWAQE